MVECTLNYAKHRNYIISQLNKGWKFIQNFSDTNYTQELIIYESVLINGLYWCISSLYLLCQNSEFYQLEIIKEYKNYFIQNFENLYIDSTTHGIKPFVNYPDSILSTLHGIQLLQILKIEISNTQNYGEYVSRLQDLKSGGFNITDKNVYPWIDESDLRYTLCALAILKQLNLDINKYIDVQLCVQFIISCHNSIDGGFGAKPNLESHASFLCCAISSLAILGKLDTIKSRFSHLRKYIRNRVFDFPTGRAGKKPDACYYYWLLCPAITLENYRAMNNLKETAIYTESELKKLLESLLLFQNSEHGGFHKNLESSNSDGFHTFYALAAYAIITQSLNKFTELRYIEALTAFPVLNE